MFQVWLNNVVINLTVTWYKHYFILCHKLNNVSNISHGLIVESYQQSKLTASDLFQQVIDVTRGFVHRMTNGGRMMVNERSVGALLPPDTVPLLCLPLTFAVVVERIVDGFRQGCVCSNHKNSNGTGKDDIFNVHFFHGRQHIAVP